MKTKTPTKRTPNGRGDETAARLFERALEFVAESKLDKSTRDCNYGICYALSNAQGDIGNQHTPAHALLEALFNRNDGERKFGYWWGWPNDGRDYGARIIALQLAACWARDFGVEAPS